MSVKLARDFIDIRKRKTNRILIALSIGLQFAKKIKESFAFLFYRAYKYRTFFHLFREL